MLLAGTQSTKQRGCLRRVGSEKLSTVSECGSTLEKALLGLPCGALVTRYPQDVRRVFVFLASGVLVVAGCVAIDDQTEQVVVEDIVPAPREPVESVDEPPGFDLSLYSIDEADSLWVIANKARPLNPLDYEPTGLVSPDIASAFEPRVMPDVSVALEAMYREAVEADVPFRIQSTYRSFLVQQRIKADSVSRLGQVVSDGRSARAGHSEHQTGLAVDLTTTTNTCTLDVCFADTPEGVWLSDNAWRFGFVLRYPNGKTDVTGYVFEPWHFRYVGEELAAEVWRQGNPTLEEFFGLDPAPDYLGPAEPVAPAPPEPNPPATELERGEAGVPDFPDDPE